MAAPSPINRLTTCHQSSWDKPAAEATNALLERGRSVVAEVEAVALVDGVEEEAEFERFDVGAVGHQV